MLKKPYTPFYSLRLNAAIAAWNTKPEEAVVLVRNRMCDICLCRRKHLFYKMDKAVCMDCFGADQPYAKLAAGSPLPEIPAGEVSFAGRDNW